MSHLDAQSLERLLAGDPEAVSFFREHLRDGCEDCRRFLEADRAHPELDAEVDRLLMSLAPPPEAGLDEVGFQRVMRRARPNRFRMHAAFGAIAAAALVGVFALRAPTPEQGGGIKGAPHIAVELLAALQTSQGELRRADSSETLPESGVLVLRYHATERGTALLLKSSAGQLEPLGAFPLTPGTHDLAARDGMAGVSLRGESGAVKLFLVASPGEAPPSLDAARQAIEAPGLGALGVSALSFTVGTGQPNQRP
jgi:hypothetical protein